MQDYESTERPNDSNHEALPATPAEPAPAALEAAEPVTAEIAAVDAAVVQPAAAPRRSGRGARRTGRRRYLLLVALVALAGLGLAGFLATGGGQPGTPAAVSLDASARADALQRADRAERGAEPTIAPTTTAPATPPATAAATGPSAAKKTTAAKATPAKPKPAWVTPLPGAEITSCFGMRWGVLHAGIDLAQPEGTPIRAAGAGTVDGAGWLYTGYGISVVIDHGNGYLTHYAHQSRTVVQAGQHVKAGDIIGYEGATGDVTGPHLHFEVHHGLWNQIDPAPWMRAHGVDLGC